jgi:hypothetical protein
LAAENAEEELARTNKPAPVKRASARKTKSAAKKAVAKKSPVRRAKVTSISKAA